MKKIDKKYIIIIMIIMILLCFSLIIYTITNNRKTSILQNITKDSFLIIEKIVFVPINFIEEKINDYQTYKTVEKKDKEFKKKADTYDTLNHQYKECKKEIEELKALLALKEAATDYQATYATVINRNLGYWFDILTIDKGSKDGIKVGDAVITSNGIIGEINNISSSNSTIKLLTNSNKISVKIVMEDTELYGLLTGYDKLKNIFLIEGISDNREIPVDTPIVTAGLANNYPPGIIVGYVKNIVSDNFDLSRTLEAIPSANFNDIKYVEILSRNSN